MPKLELLKLIAQKGSFPDKFLRRGGYYVTALILAFMIAFPPGRRTSTMKSAPKLKRVLNALTRARRRERALFSGILLLFMYRAHFRLSSVSPDELELIDRRIEERELAEFKPPSLRMVKLVMGPYASFFDPLYFGKVPPLDGKPRIYVSNHTLMGFDFGCLLPWLYEKHGIFLRALADHAHFQIPINAQVMRNIVGAVDGTRRNVDLLLENNQNILVYPGGAREVFKRHDDEPYTLFWENKLGFAAVAIKHGVEIVPVVNRGSEDMMKVHADLPIGWLPVPFLWGSSRKIPVFTPTSLQRMYFYFGSPISTKEYSLDDPNATRSVQLKVKNAIEYGLSFLEKVQDADTHQYRYGTGVDFRREIGKLLNLNSRTTRGSPTLAGAAKM